MLSCFSPPHWFTLLLLTCIGLLGPSPGHLTYAQSSRAYERAGNAAFKRKDYGTAFVHYANALQKRPGKASLKWKYAEMARLFNAYELAAAAYSEMAVDPHSLSRFPLFWLRRGEVARSMGRYDEAAEYLNIFLKTYSSDPILTAKATASLNACEWAKEAVKTPINAQLRHLDKKINSPYSDVAPVRRGDTLFFSSYRFRVFDKEKKVYQRQTRIMVSVDGKAAREPLRGIPAGDSAHVAHTAFTPDGNFLIFNYCKNITATEIRCELWMVNKDIKGHWTKPRKLPEPVNLDGYTQTQPSIGFDPGSKTLRLWFVSDRPGGKGGNDIWSLPLDEDWFCPCNLPFNARKPQKLPRFAAPKPEEAINTPENEASPWFHANTNTLYFSSEGWTGFGGYDVFKSRRVNKKQESPENVGFGINSSYNDLYFSLDEKGGEAFFSSNRPGTFYLDEKNKACCNDIYSARLPEVAKNTIPDQPLITLAPKSPAPPPPVPALILPSAAPDIQEFVGLPLYFDNDEPDKRTLKTTTTLTYEESVLKYLRQQDVYRQHFSKGLDAAAADEALATVDRFFEDEIKAGYDKLSELCEVLLERMKDGQQIEVFIKGFTSPRAKSGYNLNLGKRRISSVRNYMSVWSDGALAPFISDGQLRISETSFGEMQSKAGLSDDLNDVRNSVYAPDVARERRVEIIQIKVQ